MLLNGYRAIPAALILMFAGCPDSGDDDVADDDAADDDVADDDTADDDTADDDTADDDTDACDGHCANGEQDCGESDVDCGGGCDPCDVVELWGSPDGSFPTVAATADKVVVAWCHQGVRFVCKDRHGWGAVHEIDVGTTYTKSTRAQADSQGRVHLVVTQGGGADVLYAVMSADAECASSTWSTPEGLTGPEGGRYPNVDVDDTDDPHVVWHDADYTNVYYTKATAGLWSEPVLQVTTTEWDSRYPDIAVAGNAPHVVYEQDDASYSNCLPHHTHWTGSEWSDPFELVDSYHSWPQVVAEANGDAHVLYTNRFGDSEVMYRHLQGGTWGGEHVISAGSSAWTWTSLALDDTGGLHGVWHQYVGDMGQVMYATGDAASGTWGTPLQVSLDDTLDEWQAAIAVDPEGISHVVWIRVQPDVDEGQILYRAVQYADLMP